MLMTKSSRPAIRTLRGWAICVLQEAGAIQECEEHGWMRDRADPHARERAFDMAKDAAPPGVSPEAAAAEIADVLDGIGDTCPECPPKRFHHPAHRRMLDPVLRPARLIRPIPALSRRPSKIRFWKLSSGCARASVLPSIRYVAETSEANNQHRPRGGFGNSWCCFECVNRAAAVGVNSGDLTRAIDGYGPRELIRTVSRQRITASPSSTKRFCRTLREASTIQG